MRKKQTLLDGYVKQQQISGMAFLAELPNLIASVVAACFAGTIVCWADCACSMQSTLHCLIVLVIARKIEQKHRNHSRRIFDVDRLEVFCSFICDLLVVFGMILILILSIIDLTDPKRPGEALWLFVLLKISNVSFDFYFLMSQRALGRKHGSRLNDSEIKTDWYNLLSDLAVGVVVTLCYVARNSEWVLYLSPVVSILMVLWFGAQYIRHIMNSFLELTDHNLPESTRLKVEERLKQEEQLKIDEWLKQEERRPRDNPIEKAVTCIEKVRCRSMNHKIYVDVVIHTGNFATYPQLQSIVDHWENQIQELLPGAQLQCILRPGKES